MTGDGSASDGPRPHVSIVIPAYNEARRLPATLAGWREFLGAQPYTWELLVVDDGSMDATSDVAAAVGGPEIWLKANQGHSGAGTARGEVRRGRGTSHRAP